MTRRELTVWEVGSINGVAVPQLKRRAHCPFRKHKRKDKPFVVFRDKDSDKILYKCWSCDPPGDVGDAVGLHAELTNTSRRDAWIQLRDRGYAVPGLRADDRPGQDGQSNRRKKPAGLPTRGAQQDKHLVLDMVKWSEWHHQRLGAVELLAEQRGLAADRLRELGVMDIRPGVVGFCYHDPATGLPCRVKVRPLDKKTFWIEPRSENGVKALSPFYLADSLEPGRDEVSSVAILEGELDALSVRARDFRNVVSLPDGATSARTVNLEPLLRFHCWLVATDDDAEGQAAYKTLRERGERLSRVVVRVLWRRIDGDEVSEYKDANDALMAGFTREDFQLCFDRAMERTLGMTFKVA